MRIVHLSSEYLEVPVKKGAKELRIERCLLMIKNQRIKDKKAAEAFFKTQTIAIKKI